MVPILVASDIHGDFQALEKLFRIAENLKCTQFLFAGDLGLGYSEDMVEIIKNRNITFLPVLGNCDSPWDFSEAFLSHPPLFQVRKYENREIFITHGHRFQTPEQTGNILPPFSIIIQGHTHVPALEERGSYYFLNPGSASRPRG
ncbi:MAG: metallophosphoesterase family protein, partial [Sphaerochaetaceae bacterium]|nr:metallophosphoesterase family protein [Sphaerochaetaceae bacterium]